MLFALAVGVIAGVTAAFTRGEPSNVSSAATGSVAANDLDTELMLEMHGEAALIESALGGFEALHAGSSSTPDFLRSQLESRGIGYPEGATTEKLQDLLADAGITMDQMHE